MGISERVWAVALLTCHACTPTPTLSESRPPSPPTTGRAPEPLPKVGARAAFWSPSGRQLALHLSSTVVSDVDAEHAVGLWDLRRGRFVGVRTFRGGWGSDRFDGVGWSADERVVGASAYDVLQVWTAADLAPIATFTTPTLYGMFALAPKGDAVAYAGSYEDVHWATLPDARAVRDDTRAATGASGVLVRFDWALAGQRLLVHDERGAPELWAAPNGRQIATLKLGGDRRVAFAKVLGDRIAVIGVDGDVTLFDAREGVPVRVLARASRAAGPEAELPAVAFRADGLAFAVLEQNTRVTVFDVVTGQATVVRDAHKTWPEEAVKAVRLSRDGRFVAYQFGDGIHVDPVAPSPPPVRAVSKARGAPPAPPPSGVVVAGSMVDFSSDGHLLVVRGSALAAVTPDGKESWTRALGAEARVSVSPDGAHVAILDGELVLVRLGDRREIRLGLRKAGAATLGEAPAELGTWFPEEK